jgi:hypothetical protein
VGIRCADADSHIRINQNCYLFTFQSSTRNLAAAAARGAACVTLQVAFLVLALVAGPQLSAGTQGASLIYDHYLAKLSPDVGLAATVESRRGAAQPVLQQCCSRM